jgi:hypothetical protein
MGLFLSTDLNAQELTRKEKRKEKRELRREEKKARKELQEQEKTKEAGGTEKKETPEKKGIDKSNVEKKAEIKPETNKDLEVKQDDSKRIANIKFTDKNHSKWGKPVIDNNVPEKTAGPSKSDKPVSVQNKKQIRVLFPNINNSLMDDMNNLELELSAMDSTQITALEKYGSLRRVRRILDTKKGNAQNTIYLLRNYISTNCSVKKTSECDDAEEKILNFQNHQAEILRLINIEQTMEMKIISLIASDTIKKWSRYFDDARIKLYIVRDNLNDFNSLIIRYSLSDSSKNNCEQYWAKFLTFSNQLQAVSVEFRDKEPEFEKDMKAVRSLSLELSKTFEEDRVSINSLIDESRKLLDGEINNNMNFVNCGLKKKSWFPAISIGIIVLAILGYICIKWYRNKRLMNQIKILEN